VGHNKWEFVNSGKSYSKEHLAYFLWARVYFPLTQSRIFNTIQQQAELEIDHWFSDSDRVRRLGQVADQTL